MKKSFILGIVVLALLISGCQNNENLTGSAVKESIETKEINNCLGDSPCFQKALETCEKTTYGFCVLGICRKAEILGEQNNKCEVRIWSEQNGEIVNYDKECQLSKGYKLKYPNDAIGKELCEPSNNVIEDILVTPNEGQTYSSKFSELSEELDNIVNEMTSIENPYDEYGLIYLGEMSDKDLEEYFELVVQGETKSIEVRDFIIDNENELLEEGWTERNIDSMLDGIDEAIKGFGESKIRIYALIKEKHHGLTLTGNSTL